MALENLSLKEALARTAKIVGDNLVMMGVSLVGVRWVNALAGLVLGGTGLALGWTAGAGLAGPGAGQPSRAARRGRRRGLDRQPVPPGRRRGDQLHLQRLSRLPVLVGSRRGARPRRGPNRLGGPARPAGSRPGRYHQPFDVYLFLIFL